MAESTFATIQHLLAECSEDERHALFQALRADHQIHQLEQTFGARAEVILEAIHRAPELTRRMLRGVIADAAFAQSVVPALAQRGWRDDTPDGNHAFDHRLRDTVGAVTVQVKLQRSERGQPVVTNGRRFGLAAGMYMVEPQRTRTGKSLDGNGEETKTRPYRYGEFDILAVSLQPSCGDWGAFRYTLGNWLLPGAGPNEIATYQPVAMRPNEDWTDDFDVAAGWLRAGMVKRIGNTNQVEDLLSRQ
ncbi:hypothetical protein [Cupriavidus oxalaticus]|uniref:Uncharacterized protein n=1 Tax=Cupriavidus oxalaticus TaxID=96344 RepID=A0A375G3L1_9BURK|nr:hypothetical protein [Cupriavidus oxalaticus]QRQ88178.1 hypothetical protein JTE91_16420 [Cupriavidus oxalaticus]QRQ93495.1 hypothetical protein JTE92_25840 [Cupriavidus oxalaticus]WQD82122.1 hypothetical protein U0036_13585 [Cupriavidus oxalaticus]SPC14231.1 conserved hypothetical protein [Cupriavidus oxalaticus]